MNKILERPTLQHDSALLQLFQKPFLTFLFAITLIIWQRFPGASRCARLCSARMDGEDIEPAPSHSC